MRAISIIMVLLGHLKETLPAAMTNNKFFMLFFDNGGFLANAPLGVMIFFVISGYLITRLLIAEKQKTGTISLKNFYIRRILRIFPVFYLYIIVIVLLKIFFIPELFESYALVGVAALYVWNYSHLIIHKSASDNGAWFFGHFWSLSMEEQFYLIWPFMFWKLSSETLKKVTIWIIVLMPFVRVATYFFMRGSRGQIGMMLHTGGNVIFIGCLGALLENTNFFKEKISRLIYNNKVIWATGVFLFIVSCLLSRFAKGLYVVPAGTTLNSLCIILLLFWCVNVPSKVADFLNTKVMIEIGILSYSLYIWQQLFLTTTIHYWFNQFPQNIFLVFIVASISYYGIEKPILQLKAKFKKV